MTLGLQPVLEHDVLALDDPMPRVRALGIGFDVPEAVRYFVTNR